MSEDRSRIEYLIPTNDIILLDSYFNLMNKYNIIDDLIRFFDYLVVAYFFWSLYILLVISLNSAQTKDRTVPPLIPDILL